MGRALIIYNIHEYCENKLKNYKTDEICNKNETNEKYVHNLGLTFRKKTSCLNVICRFPFLFNITQDPQSAKLHFSCSISFPFLQR